MLLHLCKKENVSVPGAGCESGRYSFVCVPGTCSGYVLSDSSKL